ncbi:MAG: hypothetical protein AUI50_01980 [Crenarchaeota archaeon 13_1_40CM_2_52_14]|nr:MAG: hypothetical protein AUI97_06135 [Crenarchaeota archaeon 13_1_40CM_3_52_17]OLD35491.1 MAG: hypothetical protein AUI50_01980 [Crenarchaeota archaeon 13_1_40CM_2_52_14]OLE70621.1 MAG: hypothetical protein AUF78_05735 [archaeon 13_1_20CM_2_51_12]
MTENQKPQSKLYLGLADQRFLATVVDASLKRGSGLSIALSDATVGISLDKLGDWTITVGLSSRSDQFRQSISSLETLGFFQATENEGNTYMLWTSLLSEDGEARIVAEQTLLQALKALKEHTISPYIS